MGKVSSLNNSGLYRKTSTDKSKIKKEKPTKKIFNDLLESELTPTNTVTGIDPIDENSDIEDLLDAVHKRGEALIEVTNKNNIEEYKHAVKKFMEYIVVQALNIESIEGAKFNRFKPVDKQKRYTLISIIDDKLDKLASGILLNQKKQLDLLAKVEEINGLLVNLIS